ncbi:VOC family protein [Streptomyces sp. NPDC047525]|uniref:VOC family protein n=1 Tax=Streptomyces sp. NPDC047525 TaxID=3155264 RepID=UPI0033EE7601
MTGEPSFFEIGVEDPERGRAFYGELLGWSFEPGPSGQGYVISTPGVPGGMHGGDAGAAPYLFFRVDDMDTALATVIKLGGTVEAPIGGESEESDAAFGRFRLCKDDQGSTFGLHQPPPAR